MSDSQATVQNISDTARWAAVFRARETERPDALFRDPYARRLAGERGFQIVENLKSRMGRLDDSGEEQPYVTMTP